MPKLKSANHHWWPKCVSRLWADCDGRVNRLSPDGSVRRARPDNFGAIGNAHHIKMGRSGSESTPWDHSFEDEFRVADRNFPKVIDWLSGLERNCTIHGQPLSKRFHPVDASEHNLQYLVEGLISLAIRSPRNREASVAVAKQLRRAIPKRERDALIGGNMVGLQNRYVKSLGTRGKFAVCFSTNREFIFGDGFFHRNISGAVAPLTFEIFAPLTPLMAVVYAIPTSCMVDPRLVTLVLTDEEVSNLNDAVQTYSKMEIFFRSHKPELTQHFQARMHLCYAEHDHPVERLIRSIPGVHPRDHIYGWPS